MERWIELIINGLLFLVFLITFISQSLLLYKNSNLVQSERLLAPILNNIIYWFLLSFFGIFQSGYVCLAPLETRNIFFMYIVGTPFGGLSAPITLSVTFLLLDRIFALVFPLHYRKYRTEFIILTVISCIVLAIFVIFTLYFNYNIFRPRTFGKPAFGLYGGFFVFISIRVLIGTINLILSVAFIVTLNRYASTNNNRQFKKANHLAMFAAALEFVCNFIPNVLLLISFYSQLKLSEALFNYPYLMNGLDAIATAFIYRFVIKPKRRSNKVLSNTTVFKHVPLMFVIYRK